MALLTFAIACGFAANSPIFVPFGAQPDCSASPVAGQSRALVHGEDRIVKWSAEISAAARRFGIPVSWVRTVMRAESAGIPSATSPAGAMGLMQIMPGTWDQLRDRYGLGTDPYLPRDNIIAGVGYMRELLNHYGVPDFLAAYNAGPKRLDAYLLMGLPLPETTRRYVGTVVQSIVGNTLHIEVGRQIDASFDDRSSDYHGAAGLFADPAPHDLFAVVSPDRSMP